jgi:hypothetical protein
MEHTTAGSNGYSLRERLTGAQPSRVRVCICVRVHVSACACVCLRARARARVRVRMRARPARLTRALLYDADTASYAAIGNERRSAYIVFNAYNAREPLQCLIIGTQSWSGQRQRASPR